jgi:hypothetical protein
LKAFQINEKDNVATMLEEGSGVAKVLGPQPQELTLLESVALGHKVALRDLNAGDPVIKYGVAIGHATKTIRRGSWVHLHNLASDLDERSGTLDLHSGAPTDTGEAYR